MLLTRDAFSSASSSASSSSSSDLRSSLSSSSSSLSVGGSSSTIFDFLRDTPFALLFDCRLADMTRVRGGDGIGHGPRYCRRSGCYAHEGHGGLFW